MTTVDEIYQTHLGESDRAMTPHLPRIHSIALRCIDAVEFGVKHGASSSAILAAGVNFLTSYDIVETREACRLKAAAGDRWDYRIEDSRKANIPTAGMLLVDSLHTYAQCRAELSNAARKIRKYLVFHDTLTFGSVGADGESGRQLWAYTPQASVPHECLGIRPAIDELMIQDPSWRIAASYTDSHGLLVLRRVRG